MGKPRAGLKWCELHKTEYAHKCIPCMQEDEIKNCVECSNGLMVCKDHFDLNLKLQILNNIHYSTYTYPTGRIVCLICGLIVKR